MNPETTITKDTSPTFFSGWRPLIGWISVVGLGINFILFPLTGAAFAAFSHPIVLPSLDIGPLITLITTVLGLGGLRTVEKITGVCEDH